MIDELVRMELHAVGAKIDGNRIAMDGPLVALPHRSVHILPLHSMNSPPMP